MSASVWDHGEPVMAPKVDIDSGPVAIILDLLGIEHDSAVRDAADGIGRQSNLLDDGVVSINEPLAHPIDAFIVFWG